MLGARTHSNIFLDLSLPTLFWLQLQYIRPCSQLQPRGPPVTELNRRTEDTQDRSLRPPVLQPPDNLQPPVILRTSHKTPVNYEFLNKSLNSEYHRVHLEHKGENL